MIFIYILTQEINKSILYTTKSEEKQMSEKQMSEKQMSENKSIQLGLCCLNTVLRKQKPPIFASRKMIMRTIKEQGIDVFEVKDYAKS